MFAVIKTGGRQYRVVPDDVLEIGKIAGEVGTIVQLGEVLVVGGDTPVLGTPTVAGATVAGQVLQHGRGPKVIAFKKRRRKNSRRKRGHRQEFTLIRITEILTDGKKPSKTAAPRVKKPEPKAEAAQAEPDAAVESKPAPKAKAKAKAAAKPKTKAKGAAKPKAGKAKQK